MGGGENDSPHSIESAEPTIILDFFAGSGTTAHAVMELNAEDGGNRQFILVQLDEAINPKNKAAFDFCQNTLKSETPTIFDITQERIKRAAKKLKSENKSGDFGFNRYTLSPAPSELLEVVENSSENLFNPENIANNAEFFDALLLVYRLYDAIPLNIKSQTITINGYTAAFCENNLYLFNPHFDIECVKALLEKIDSEADFVPKRIIIFWI